MSTYSNRKANKQKYTDLLKDYTRLVKRADDRLRALEKYASDPHFKGITQFAYKRAVHDIRSRWGGTNRFRTTPPRTLQGLEAKLADIKRFLDSPTSTKRGIIKVYKSRADTLNKHYNTNFTWQELADYWGSKAQAVIEEKFKDSGTTVKALDRLLRPKESKKVTDKITKDIDKMKKEGKGFFDIVDNVANQINKVLDNNNIDIDKMFNN